MKSLKTVAAHWRFIDGEERAREHPDTFQIPSVKERETIQPGALIKFGVERHAASGGERVWARVVARGQQIQGYIAQIEQADILGPRDGFDHGLRHGDLVAIQPKHILKIGSSEAIAGLKGAWNN